MPETRPNLETADASAEPDVRFKDGGRPGASSSGSLNKVTILYSVGVKIIIFNTYTEYDVSKKTTQFSKPTFRN